MLPKLIQKILKQLNYSDLLINCSLVSKEWHKIVQKIVEKNDLIKDVKYELLKRLIYFERERGICLSQTFTIDSDVNDMYQEWKMWHIQEEEQSKLREIERIKNLKKFIDDNPELKDPDVFLLKVFEGYCNIS